MNERPLVQVSQAVQRLLQYCLDLFLREASPPGQLRFPATTAASAPKAPPPSPAQIAILRQPGPPVEYARERPAFY